MKLFSLIIFKKLGYSALFIVMVTSLLAQNPLDLKSKKDESIATETISTINQKTKNPSTSNPLDVKKEPNKQKTKSQTNKEIKQNVNDGYVQMSKPIKISLLLASIIFFVLTRNINQIGFQKISQSFLNPLKLVSYNNSLNRFLNRQLGLFYSFFFFNAAYFIYLCFEKYSITPPNILGGSFLSILLIILVIYIVKYVVLYILEYALSIRRAIANHLFSVSIHNILLGFILFFINSFLAFTTAEISSALMYVGLGCIVIFYLIRQVKGLQYLSDLRHFNIFHFFIYLCGCEISPLLVAVKFATG
ncbi:MAG: DUF4271 domain-containing protein [Saprospiraceae bacterium]